MGCCVPMFAGELVRSFVCIEIPEAHRAKIADWVKTHSSVTDEIRWMRAETLHITLKFCGERPQEIVDALVKRLSEMKPCGAMQLSLSGIGGFPKLEKARIVWTGINGDTDRLTELAKNVSRLAESCGMERERKTFAPHVTLGRRNEFGYMHDEVVTALRQRELKLEPWTVTEFVLMRSRLLPAGAEYTPIQRFKI